MILRTEKNANYTPPTGGSLSLPVNCAVNDSERWHWKYFWTKTLGTGSPVTTNGIERSDGTIDEEASQTAGQSVMRTIFAYVATEEISVYVDLQADAGGSNTTLIAKLYDLDGSLVKTYHQSNDTTFGGFIELPATTCPKVLWLGAAAQPTGTTPLPDTTVFILLA